MVAFDTAARDGQLVNLAPVPSNALRKHRVECIGQHREVDHLVSR
jgi:hypothetical protein